MRYFLDRDEDSHWYIVREDKRSEWESWVDSDAYAPDFDPSPPDDVAYSIGGWPGQVIFENPVCWGNPVDLGD